MRILIGIVVALGVAAGAARGGEREQAVAVVERAIKAHGGAEALAKAQTRSRTGKGLINDQPFTTEETVQFPDRCRMAVDLGRNRLVLVLNGDKGWMQAGGSTVALNKEAFQERREELYVWWLTTLTPLLKDEFTLAPLPDARVNGEDAAVVKASSRGNPDVSLFFDKKDGHLLKIARRGTLAGVPVYLEYLYGDYKDYDGAKLPTKETILSAAGGGAQKAQKLSEVKIDGYKLLSRVEDKTFSKP